MANEAQPSKTQYTLRCSTIFFTDGSDEIQVEHSIEDLPSTLRKRLADRGKSGATATIFIANRGGREELAKRLRGLPSRVRTRLESSSLVAQPEPQKRTLKAPDFQLPTQDLLSPGQSALLGALGLGLVMALLKMFQ